RRRDQGLLSDHTGAERPWPLPQAHPRRDRRIARATRHGLRRPLPRAPLGHGDADRGDDGSPPRRRPRRQGPLPRRQHDARLAVREGPARGRTQRLDEVRLDAEPLQPSLPRGRARDDPALPRPGRRSRPLQPARPSLPRWYTAPRRETGNGSRARRRRARAVIPAPPPDRRMSASRNLAAAAKAAADCLGVGARDQVLVLCNEAERAVAEALVAAAQSRTGAVRLLEYPTLSRNGEEPPDHVAQAMCDASVVFATTTYSISHTQARLAATAAGTRIASMRGFAEAYAQAMSVDYRLLRSNGARLAAALTAAESCWLTSAAGTDI